MACKFIKIGSGQYSLRKKFEFVEVRKNNFMLKTKDSHVGLFGTLEKWLGSNNSIEESSYSEMLWNKSSSIVKEAYKADNLFIGGQEKLTHWSVSQKKVTQDYGGIIAGWICSMAQITGKK